MTGKGWLIALLVSMVATPAYAAPIGFSVQSNGNDHLYQIDLATGVATDLGLVGINDAEGLAFANNQLYAIGGSLGEFWNITTPPGVLVGPTGARNGTDAGLDFDPISGTMFNINGSFSSSHLYNINLGTGAATLVGSNGTFLDDLGINGSGQAFAADAIFTDSFYQVNLSTGVTTLVGSLGIGNVSAQAGASFDANGVFWLLLSDGRIFTVNTGTGAATFVAQATLNGNPIDDFEGLAINNAADIPEPATLALWSVLGLGMVGCGWWRRKAVVA